ncbi:MAG TPA: ASPIC/UnbV domain-containing protein, partial [Chthonomonadaceae bacterium]|nr:ASPIC/UnbV domain-containing protein [Chthonomonadaceae bacterium]
YVHSGGSFLSECQREPTFGLGAATQADRVEILWPSGIVDTIGPLAADHQYVLDEGQGAGIDRRFKPGRQR